MEKMQKLFVAQSESILAIVNDIFLKGEFPCHISDPVGPSETVIGTVNDWEKSILIAINNLANKHNAAMAEALKQKIEPDKHQSFLSHKTCESLLELCWTNIKRRLNKPAIETGSIGIRQDWQIVAFENKEPRVRIHCVEISLDEIFEV